MKKLKILFVTEHYPPHIGGVETFFFELRKRLMARGHKVDVVTSVEKGALKVEKEEGGTIYRVGEDRHSFTLFAIPLVMKLAAKADIIHATLYNAALPAFVAAKIHGKKSVLSVHEVLGRDFTHITEGRRFKASLFMFLEKILLGLPFDKYVAVSKVTQNKLRGRRLKKSEVIYHGVDEMFKRGNAQVKNIQSQNIKEFSSKTPSNERSSCVFELLYFGRIASNKGIWFLLECLQEFFREEDMRTKVRFTLLLSGSVRDFKKVNEKMIGLADCVSVKKSVAREDLPAAIALADAVVVPSLAEGFGFSAAEAMAVGVPVVLSDAGSLPEIAGGKHLIFKSGDKADLIEALKKAVLGEWEEKAALDFSWDKAAEEFERVYLGL